MTTRLNIKLGDRVQAFLSVSDKYYPKYHTKFGKVIKTEDPETESDLFDCLASFACNHGAWFNHKELSLIARKMK